MLEKFSDDEITQVLKDMEVKDNNSMRQEFVEGLRNGRPNNYVGLRICMDKFNIDHQFISTEKITEDLQFVGWRIISKMREEILNGVLDKDPEGYNAFREFFSIMGKA